MRPNFKRRKRSGEGGQAAIEFMAVVIVLFFFLLFFLSLSILLVTSEYIDYATFMAARTYKSAFSGEQRQRANAQLVFDSYFEKIQGIARKPQLQFKRTDPNDPQTEGVIASYEMDLFYMPPIFLAGAPGDVSKPSITLFSESHLGRDPTFTEVCDPSQNSFFIQFIRQQGIQNGDSLAEQMDDNGC